MPCERKPMRYGHSEGHTDVTFDDAGKFIVTCGSDGDVRIWESLDDDDPRSINVGEKAYSLALKKRKLVTAGSNNTVQIHTFPEGDPDGILTRFTTHATHVAFNHSGSRVAAGSSDFMVKVVEVADSSQQKTLRGHDAPVLSVTFDPKDELLYPGCSRPCNLTVVVHLQTKVTSWPVLQKSNDVSTAKSLCRLGWQPKTAKLLAVPVGLKVHLYERDSWEHVSTLSDDMMTQPINVVAWSPCGQLLAAGSVGGFLTVWNAESKLCVERQKHEKGYTVCGLAWHPSGRQLAYTDTQGSLGLLDDLPTASSKIMCDEELGRYPPSVTSADTVSLALGQGKYGDDDDAGSTVAPPTGPSLPLRPAYEGPLPTLPQKPFQPGSTPAHLTHRFMTWNSVGVVRGYNDDQDNAVDVEFHDTAVHHAMHLTNALGHTLADLSQEAVLLACPATDELASKLQCLHFSSWDANKEWIVDLPAGEDVRALVLGQGWAAAATSARTLRLFTVGGVQKEIFSLPGHVVSMAAHGEQLLVVYHRGTGFDGDQALGVQLLQLGRRKRQVIHGEPLPLSCKAHLAWLGFTAEGTPCYVDSEGVVRMLNRSLGNTWTPVCNTRETCKGKSDHFWVVAVHENPQQLRCIPCKGSRYPPTLPRPAVAILPFKLPLCQTTTEKGQMEEQYWRSTLLQNHYSFLSSSGYEIDDEGQNQNQKEQQELLMKMFALSCKLEREFRCMELAELMTQSVVTLAVRYASRSRRMNLAQRLNELAMEKANQLQEEQEQEEEEVQEEEHHTPRRKSPSQSRVSNVLDSMTSVRRPAPLGGPSGKQSKGPVLKPLAPKPKTKVSLIQRPWTGFQLWLEENRKSILADSPDLQETDVIKAAMGSFRSLSAEDRLSWTERAKGQSGEAADLKKRKRVEEAGEGDESRVKADENIAKKKKSLDTTAKLSAFAFNKN
uniref:WD repeat and HMG-box DNA binding protein 1 n=1 Tax=Gadus morhua TaxID=8049 RepID=A0A8C5C3R5_GADMO